MAHSKVFRYVCARIPTKHSPPQPLFTHHANRTMPAKAARKRNKQSSLGDSDFVVLHKASDPKDDIGKQIMVLDEYWAISTPEGMWACTIMAYDADRAFGRGTRAPAYQLYEPTNKEQFWMKTPEPFLRYRNLKESLALCPALLPPPPPEPETGAAAAGGATAVEADEAEAAAKAGGESRRRPQQDLHLLHRRRGGHRCRGQAEGQEVQAGSLQHRRVHGDQEDRRRLDRRLHEAH